MAEPPASAPNLRKTAPPSGAGDEPSALAAAAMGEPHAIPEPPPWLRPVVDALDMVAALCMAVAGVMMVTLIAIFGWLVYGRYILNDTPTWVEQAALILVVWITFLGAAVGVWRNTHLSIDFIREALPAAPREVMRLLTDALLAVFGGFMAWFGASLAMGSTGRIVPMLGLSEAWRAAPLGVCGALVMVFSLTRLAERLGAPARKA